MPFPQTTQKSREVIATIIFILQVEKWVQRQWVVCTGSRRQCRPHTCSPGLGAAHTPMEEGAFQVGDHRPCGQRRAKETDKEHPARKEKLQGASRQSLGKLVGPSGSEVRGQADENWHWTRPLPGRSPSRCGKGTQKHSEWAAPCTGRTSGLAQRGCKAGDGCLGATCSHPPVGRQGPAGNGHPRPGTESLLSHAAGTQGWREVAGRPDGRLRGAAEREAPPRATAGEGAGSWLARQVRGQGLLPAPHHSSHSSRQPLLSLQSWA